MNDELVTPYGVRIPDNSSFRYDWLRLQTLALEALKEQYENFRNASNLLYGPTTVLFDKEARALLSSLRAMMSADIKLAATTFDTAVVENYQQNGIINLSGVEALPDDSKIIGMPLNFRNPEDVKLVEVPLVLRTASVFKTMLSDVEEAGIVFRLVREACLGLDVVGCLGSTEARSYKIMRLIKTMGRIKAYVFLVLYVTSYSGERVLGRVPVFTHSLHLTLKEIQLVANCFPDVLVDTKSSIILKG